MTLGLGAWLTLAASDHARPAVLVAAALGAVLMALALGWPGLLGPALGTSGGAYALLLAIDDPPLDGRALGVAAALVISGELSSWSRELRSATRDEPGNAWRRPVWIASLGMVTLVVTAGLLAVVDLAQLDGLVVEVVGAVAALIVVVALVRLARTPAASPETPPGSVPQSR